MSYSHPLLRHPFVLKAGRRLRNTKRKPACRDMQSSADSAAGFSINAL